MKAKQASHTAEGAAAMRAGGCYFGVPEMRNPDFLAEKLLGTRLKRVVKNGLFRKAALAIYGYRLPGMFEVHQARTKHYDALVKQEIEAGVEQYVVLGAGLDSRAYRFVDALEGKKVFEVDHPATSAFKRERLREAGISSDHVTFVEVDFLHQRAEDRLMECGFDPSKRTVVTWEGVIMYLDTDAVRQVFEWVSTLADGSSIAFDYTYVNFHKNPERYRYAKRHLNYVKKAGEPYTFGLDFEDVDDFVDSCGLRLLSNINAETLDARYLQGYRGKVTPWYAMAHARKK